MTTIRALIGRFLPRGAVVLSVLTFGSYAMGLVRDRIFARTYGAGAELDAYNAAFVLPELLFDVFIAAGLAAPFVPIFMKLVTEEAEAAQRFARTILTLAAATMGAAAVVLFLVAPATIDLIAPGFASTQQRQLYVDLFRIMCITPLIFSTSIVLGEVLVAKRRFVYYGLASLLYNVGIVLGTLLLHEQIGIFGAAIGAVIGALLHLAIRVVGILRTDVRLQPQLDLRMPAVREFLRLMVPRMAGAPIEPLTFQFFTRVASTFAAGSVSAVSFARNFQSVPVSLIGVAFSIAAFPALSTAAGRGDRNEFVRVLRTNVATIAVLTVAAAFALLLLSRFAIELFLGGGAFVKADVDRTSALLSIFAFSVPIESLTYPLARAIYATRNTILPVAASLAGLVTTIVTATVLAPTSGLSAVPIAFIAGSVVKLVVLAAAVPGRIRRIPALATVELSEEQ
jgi:putative peptidoglycan lipid II flippase